MKTWEYQSKNGRTINVRPAQRSDAQLLHDGFKSVVDEGKWLPTFTANASITDWIHWIDRAIHTREILLVAFLDNEYAGHLTLQPEEWNASQHVAKLGVIVKKSQRNFGVGRALLVSAEKMGLDRDYTKIILSTFNDNTVAIELYKHLGYRLVGVRKNHFNMPKGFIDEVLMEKELL